ncbi:MAG TPA: aminotransferase class I/II-fold pyridoxal phosphate-dependent enzyme [Acidimicrobiia bacterium]|jgi:aspartate/methionine/tyrosine aminotransferase|nr:aminotransferase class I/II-fold pyridoxal phosphate-dependent enzyme [Acidimicrobiia bacterium]
MRTAQRWAGFGQTVFTEITELARLHGAINLGQGFPDFDGPDFVKDAAAAAMRSGENQYARMFGVPELNEAIAARFAADTGRAVDPVAEVTVTSGCTEALASSFLGLVDPGDEVVLIEPYYDSYPAGVALAGATPRYVTLRPPGFRLERDALEAVVGPATRAIVVNTPHNPAGRVFDEQELQAVADVAIRHDALVFADEVYERLVFDGAHRSIAMRPGMWERTVTMSSLGKSFSLTGWKIGWAIAPPELTAGVRAAHQFLTFATAAPLQHGAVAALHAPDDYYDQLVAGYRRKRDLLAEGLDRVGFDVFVPEGTYFILADHRPFGFADDVAFSRHLTAEIGVAAIPPSAFYHDPADGADLIRFAFCKGDVTLRAAVERLEGLRR